MKMLQLRTTTCITLNKIVVIHIPAFHLVILDSFQVPLSFLLCKLIRNLFVDYSKYSSSTIPLHCKLEYEKSTRSIELRPPGECVMRTLFYDFTQQTARKMEEVMAEPLVRIYETLFWKIYRLHVQGLFVHFRNDLCQKFSKEVKIISSTSLL